MRISSLMVAVLLISVFLVGIYDIIGNMAGTDGYDITLDTTYSQSFDGTSNITTQIKNDYETITGNNEINETGWTIVDKVNNVLGLANHATSLLSNMVILPIRVVGEFVETITNIFGLPFWLSGVIIALITAFIIFALIAIIMRFQFV